MKKILKLVLLTTMQMFLCGATYPYENSQKIKIVGLTGMRPFIATAHFSLKKDQKEYSGQFEITSEKRSLWKHSWGITEDDFENIIEFEYIKPKTMSVWVKNIFQEDTYGVKIMIRKISKNDIDEEVLKEATKKYKITPQEIIREIESDESPLIINYRAEWREDLIWIVYIKSLDAFICYRRGID